MITSIKRSNGVRGKIGGRKTKTSVSSNLLEEKSGEIEVKIKIEKREMLRARGTHYNL